MAFTIEKRIRATRLCLAMFISFIYTSYVGVSEGIWVVMTCPIVLFDNATLGGTINKSHLRFWGTFLSAAFGMIFIVGFANNVTINLIAIGVGVFLATYWYMDGKQGYAGGLMTWTLPILLLNHNDLKSAFLRLLNISLGIVISYLLLRFFYPEYARNKMLSSMRNTLSELENLVIAITDEKLNDAEIQAMYLQHETNILTNINGFMRWQNEAVLETKAHPEYVSSGAKAFLHVRRLYRLLSVMVFHFDCSRMRTNQEVMDKFGLIKQQMDLIIIALQNNRHDYYLPEQWLQIEPANLELQDTSDIHHHALSALSISNIIYEEMRAIMANLVIFFQSRKANNYY